MLAALIAGATNRAAAAASNGAGFFVPAPMPSPVHSPSELNEIFVTGIGRYDEPSMKDKLFAYPLPRGGQFGAPLYNGCYDRKGSRLGNLDANFSCAAVNAANPGRAIFRLFLGYKIECSGGIVGGKCQNTQLLLNCEYKQVQVGVGSLESAEAPTRYCSNESGILRNARGNSSNDNAYNGCAPGEDGTTYSPNLPCTKCAIGTFNANFNPNNVVCTTCDSTITVANVDPGFPIQASDWVTSKNPDGSSPFTGATSSGDCRLKTGAAWKCAAGFKKDDYEQYCMVAPSPTPIPSPSPSVPPSCPYAPPMNIVGNGTVTGDITANLFNNVGTLTSMYWTQPGTGTCTISGPTGNSMNCNGVSPGTYTIVATDPANTACTASAVVVVGPAPSPSPTPSPTPACDVMNDVASSTNYLNCTYSCAATQTISSGKCGDPGPLNKIRTQRSGCSAATATACTFRAPGTNFCTASLCPGGYLYLLWDVVGYSTYVTRDSTHFGGSVCATPDGMTPYYSCSMSASPPSSNYPADFGTCTSVTGYTYYGTRTYASPPWSGGPYCSW